MPKSWDSASGITVNMMSIQFNSMLYLESIHSIHITQALMIFYNRLCNKTTRTICIFLHKNAMYNRCICSCYCSCCVEDCILRGSWRCQDSKITEFQSTYVGSSMLWSYGRWFTSTYVISGYHQYSFEVYSRPWGCVINIVSDLRQVSVYFFLFGEGEGY